MGLVLKHVERTKTGSWQYRRNVPKEVSAIITKREFKRNLGGESEKEAIAAYPRYHAEVEMEITEAVGRGLHGGAHRSPNLMQVLGFLPQTQTTLTRGKAAARTVGT